VKLRISTKTAAIRGGNVEMSPSMAPLGAGARLQLFHIEKVIHNFKIYNFLDDKKEPIGSFLA
jgi:hypothetical protein